MPWQNHPTHRAETAAIKAALRKAGIPFRSVGHGAGTAWAWLEINLGPGTSRELADQTHRIAQDVTGRRGDHGGEILVLQQ